MQLLYSSGSQRVFSGFQGIRDMFQEIRGYISIMAIVKFTYYVIKRKMFFLNNRGTSLIGDTFISCDNI